ncbi:MAG: hypothetical protein NTV04_19925 [Deltaproteobacteria bacterium]|jgi:hypothetical protein|nr:hypothetical protein [Deltaproteobacteria bacterium]
MNNLKAYLDLWNKKIIRLLQNLHLSQRLLGLLRINKHNDKMLNYYSDLGYPVHRIMMNQSGLKNHQYVTTIDLNSTQFKPTQPGNSKASQSTSQPKVMACSLIFIGEEDSRAT